MLRCHVCFLYNKSAHQLLPSSSTPFHMHTSTVSITHSQSTHTHTHALNQPCALAHTLMSSHPLLSPPPSNPSFSSHEPKLVPENQSYMQASNDGKTWVEIARWTKHPGAETAYLHTNYDAVFGDLQRYALKLKTGGKAYK